MKNTDPTKIKDLTGFEAYLLDNGFSVIYNADYFNTYTGCSRVWTKENISIDVGLMDSPTRVGLRNFVGEFNNSFLPTPIQYKQTLDRYKNK
jgi:hypothetical protein